MTTGERIKNRRKELGISAEALAERCGISPATIYRYENGEIEKVGIDKLTPIAEALYTTEAYLLGWENNSGKSGERGEDAEDESIRILSRNAKKLSPENRQKLLEMAKVLFKEEFDS